MPETTPRHIDEQYCKRIVQVQAISTRVVEAFNKDPENHLLGHAVTIHPDLLPVLCRSLDMDQETFFKKVLLTTINALKTGGALSIFNTLYRDCHIRRDSEVPIEPSALLIPVQYQNLYRERPQEFDRLCSAGASQIPKFVLGMVEGPKPLTTRYPRGFAQQHIGLTLGPRGEQSYTLPTVLDNVDLKYTYRLGQNTASLSFLVKPFEE